MWVKSGFSTTPASLTLEAVPLLAEKEKSWAENGYCTMSRLFRNQAYMPFFLDLLLSCWLSGDAGSPDSTGERSRGFQYPAVVVKATMQNISLRRARESLLLRCIQPSNAQQGYQQGKRQAGKGPQKDPHSEAQFIGD